MAKKKNLGGRPRGVEMPCGWKCGAKLTHAEMRKHFMTCPKRPQVEAAHARSKKGVPRND